jgi:hypothetical protein
MVAIKPVGGIGSRMKCIASFGAIADHFGVSLYVCWNTSDGFERIRCDELFEAVPSNVKLMDVTSWNLLRNSKGRTVKLDERISYLTQNYLFCDYKLEELFLTHRPFRLTAECNRDLQKLYGRTLHRFIPTFNEQYLRHLSSFQPVQSVKKLVAHEVACWGSANTNVLGVHVRRNDALQSRVSKKFASPTNKELMQVIDNHIEHTKADSDFQNLVFFATDDPDTFDVFAETYANEPRVRWYNWNRYKYNIREQKGGQLKALVDLVTMQCCNRVTGTTFSVFTEMARVHRVRSVVLHTYCPSLPTECTDDIVRALATPFNATEKPPTKEPTTKEPPTKEPTTEKPTTKEPTTKEPTTKEPTTKEPTTKEPTTKEPPTKEPTTTRTTNTNAEPKQTSLTISHKTLLYLYNANPDAHAFQKQIQKLLGLQDQLKVSESTTDNNVVLPEADPTTSTTLPKMNS